MRIELKISEKMDERYKAWDGKDERRKIRIPKDYRELFNFTLYDFVHMRTKSNEIVSLEVWPAYKEDTFANTLCAYVTSEIFNLLMVEGVEVFDVEVEPIDGLTIGCDPEFYLVNAKDGSIFPAHYYFKKNGVVGSDGNLLEIRPLPSTSEHTVCNRLYSAILETRNKINADKDLSKERVEMIAASFRGGVAAGFHIHLGLPTDFLFAGTRAKAALSGLVRALDYYVGVPCAVAEGVDCIRRSQPRIGYGKPGNYRIEPPPPTLEYRVPGGFMLRHPTLSCGMLGLAAVVAEDLASRLKLYTQGFKVFDGLVNESYLKDFYPDIPKAIKVAEIICSESTARAKLHLDKIIDDVGNMITFEDREESVSKFFKALIDDDLFSNKLEENWRNYYHGQDQQKSVGYHGASV